MKYMLLMYANESQAADFTPEDLQAVNKDWQVLLKDAHAAGVIVATNGLAPVTSATSVRVREGKTLITDGPFAETHEQFGGYFLLNCKDIDEAIGWAARIPHAKYGTVEIRPLYDYS